MLSPREGNDSLEVDSTSPGETAETNPELPCFEESLLPPVMDAHEAIRRIRAMECGKDAKIIAVTASAMDDNRQELMEIGANDFIGKPFREVELFQKIHSHLGVEYVYAEDPTPAVPERAAELTPGSLAGWPPDLIRPMREAVISADLDDLLAKIEAIEARDPGIAHGLRRLAEQFEYQQLLDLFGPEESAASSPFLVESLP